jgi:Asp-tRNA(Asn)/Glu-tRNA(Gln) amidotransferase A subunit family amidase
MKINFITAFSLVLILLLLHDCTSQNQKGDESTGRLDLMELTISQIHEAYKNQEYTCVQLVQAYLERIEVYDQQTKLNAIVVINPEAIETAQALDIEFNKTGKLRPLHGIPLIVKDNYNTKGLQTTGGSAVLRGFKPELDSYQVQKLKEAGAVVIAKSNMAEWAFSPKHTISSIAGETLNPYNLNHVPAGSSGGTGAAVAANFGTVGLGTDTGNSIRGPSSHNALVGFRSTLGLTSRHGIIPLYLRNDVGGPMCRTVEDATRILEIITGYDPNDPITQFSIGKMPDSYQKYLKSDGVQGSRIGVLRQLSEDDPHPEIKVLFENAISDLKKLGGEIIDPFIIPNFDSLRKDQWCSEFKKDINHYLTTFVKQDSLQTLEDIVESGKYSAFAEEDLKWFMENEGRDVEKDIKCKGPFTDPKRIAFRESIEKAMDKMDLDVIIYPTWNHPPARTSDYSGGYKGDNSQIIAPHTGQPAFTVPMGFTGNNLPAGLQFLGRLFDESALIKITYGYEQGTLHRHPPKLYPELKIN